MSSKISKRKQREKLDKHTELCLKNFYAVMGIALARLGYTEDDIMQIYHVMDEIYGTENNFIKTCRDESGVDIV